MIKIMIFVSGLVCAYCIGRVYYIKSRKNYKNNYLEREGCKEFLKLLSEKYEELYDDMDKKETKADKISTELWQFLSKEYSRKLNQTCPYCYSDNTTEMVEYRQGDNVTVCMDCNKEILREAGNIIGRKKMSGTDFQIYSETNN